MKIHRGNIVKSIVKQSGYSLITLAKRLGISRSTLHNRLNTQNLPYEFIYEVGLVIGFDFSLIFDELKVSQPIFESKSSSHKDGYITFLNHYSNLLDLATKTLVKSNNLQLHERIIRLLEINLLTKINKAEILSSLKKKGSQPTIASLLSLQEE